MSRTGNTLVRTQKLNLIGVHTSMNMARKTDNTLRILDGISTKINWGKKPRQKHPKT